jgi:hypothetical protein
MTAPQGAPTTPPGTTHTTPSRRPGPRHVALVTILATVVLAAAATGTPWSWNAPGWLSALSGDQAPPPEPAPAPVTPPVEPPPPPPLDDAPFGLGDVLLALAGLALLVIAVLALRNVLARIRRSGTPAPPVTATPGHTLLGTPEDDVAPHLRDGLSTAQQHLTAAVPPRDAVVAAWVALEDAAALAGAHRDPAQTPTEFTVAVLDRTRADPGAVATLRALYHRARFRDADIGTSDVQTARDALRRLADDLAIDAPDRTPDA